MAQDPVCGMTVDELRGIRVNRDGQDYFFCSTHCKDKFLRQEKIKDNSACSPLPGKPLFKNKLFITVGIPALLLILSLFFPLLVAFRNSFLMYLKTIWWAVLAGLFLGGVIDYYIPREYISKILAKKSPLTIFNAVFLGFLMSACSHGILALSMQLHKKGASNPSVVSFLLASPWANFTITVMLVGLFGMKGLFIIVAALIVAVNTGLIFMFLEKKGLIEKNKNIVDVPGQFSIFKDLKIRLKNYRFSLAALADDFKGVIKGAIALSDMVLWWIILGMLIASIAGAYIPTHFFHRFMGPTLLGLVVTLGLATIIEVCSEGSSPLAFEIYRQTGALGNSFVFLMAGVATDYTEIGLLWANVGRRVALWMPVVTVPQVVIIGYLANIIFR
ncbi:MAG: permease [Candidatus Omnitrophica bacterium]|nr:permease [Candidatus Omnitrophota bacterium]MDD5592191.1 permease [Candidatus Omnitrophota bacterium]